MSVALVERLLTAQGVALDNDELVRIAAVLELLLPALRELDALAWTVAADGEDASHVE